MYYLQSRYYDPVICRFINSDEYTSTGHGLIGYNMFAYCGNNPVNYYDVTGYIPQAIEDAIVHNKVLKEIAGQNSDLRYTQTCIYYNGTNRMGGWGFCDLYNISTGEIWELKKDSTSWSCMTPQASQQLINYTKGKLKHYPDLNLSKPYTTNIVGGSFPFTMAGYNYSVKYWNEGQGILRYSYSKQKNEMRKTAEMVVGVAALTVAVGYFAPASLPAFASTYVYAMLY